MSAEQDEAAVDMAVAKILGWMIDESDDIEGTCLRLTLGEPGPWIHTTAQVRTWLRERLPDAVRHTEAVAAMTVHEPTADDCDPAGLVCSQPHHLSTVALAAVTDVLTNQETP